MKRVDLIVEGMSCPGCAAGVEKKLRSLGASDISVDFASSKAAVSLPADADITAIATSLTQSGYPTRERPKGPAAVTPPARLGRGERQLIIAAAFTLPLLLHMVVPWHPLHNPLVQLLLATPVFVIGIQRFGVSAYRSLRNRSPNMDVLIIGGATAAYLYSLIGLLFALGPDYLFFETAATIITAVLLGNFFEARSVRRTTSAIDELRSLQPETAQRVTDEAHNSIVEVSIDAISHGDILLVRNGDRIPADGVITWGQGSIDESILTGESLPVDRGLNDPVAAGTVLVAGTVRMRVEGLREETTLAKIVALVEHARAEKPAIQRLGDTVSAYFVPAVAFIALLTVPLSLLAGVSFTDSLLRGIAVLVISCPCAMGLATPTAVMVGLGRAARRGILIRRASVFEELSHIRSIGFDKTGTLTTGDFSLARLTPVEEPETDVASILRGLAQHSAHPISQSLVRIFRDSPAFAFESVQEEKGVGLFGRTADGTRYALGSAKVLPEGTAAGPHTLFLIRDGSLLATLDLLDTPRTEAKDVIAALHGRDITVTLLSGDRPERVQELAAEVGIDTAHGGLSPQQKIDWLRSHADRSRIAFVGDGINDAPALSAATVGISLGDASHVARDAADVVLLHGNLRLLPQALAIAERTVLTIKQNLFWAFFYNIVAIPLAALGYLDPMLAAFTMAFSDVIVIGNSLRLRVVALKET